MKKSKQELKEEVAELMHQNEVLNAKCHAALLYCKGHTDTLWAAIIVSHLLGCDFRDAGNVLKEYLENETLTRSRAFLKE